MHLFAGMPSAHLTDVAKLRLENVSFFLAGFLLCALGIMLLWNYLARDWTFLPRLSYGKALGLTALWGLLFVLVLTMISGARELMTPGAWEKKGATYQLVDEGKANLLQERKAQLGRLKELMWAYADSHGEQFPPAASDPAIPASFWTVPGPAGGAYVYLPARRGAGTAPLVLEPEVFGTERLVLGVDGVIRTMTSDEIARALPAGVKK